MTGVAALVEKIPPTHWLFIQVVFTTGESQYNTVIVIDPNATRKDWKVRRIVRT